MPIDIDRFEGSDALRSPSTSERIVRFLRHNDGQAFTRSEIAEAVDADPETVGTNLTRLKERGRVRHRSPYWAFSSDSERSANENLEEDDDVSLRNECAEGNDRTVDEASTFSSAMPHRDAVTAFVETARDRLGDRIDTLYLFGSVARGTQTASSDVDVLAVVADEAEYAVVDDELLDIAYDVQLAHEVPLEVHSMRASEFAARKERDEPFVRTVVEEGEICV